MSEKFQNKYRIPSARLKNWDYGSNGAYFITICTQNREHFFGKIIEAQFIASELGALAEKYWLEIPQHFPFVKLGNFVVMPNHTHGILIIDKNANDENVIDGISRESCQSRQSCQSVVVVVETLQCNVSTTTANATTANATTGNVTTVNANANANVTTTNINATTTDNTIEIAETKKNEQMAKISPKSGSIATIIRSYKSVVSKNARLIHADFGWQSRFHDHIIRNSQEMERIQHYIKNNPLNWKEDKFF